MKKIKLIIQSAIFQITVVILVISIGSSVFAIYEITSLKETVIKNKSLQESIPKIYENYNKTLITFNQEYLKKYNNINKIRPEEDGLVEFMNQIEDLAFRERIATQIKSAGSIQGAGETKNVSYTLSLKTDLTEAINFLKKIEYELPYLISIESFSSQNNNKNGVGDVQINLSLYIK